MTPGRTASGRSLGVILSVLTLPYSGYTGPTLCVSMSVKLNMVNTFNNLLDTDIDITEFGT